MNVTAKVMINQLYRKFFKMLQQILILGLSWLALTLMVTQLRAFSVNLQQLIFFHLLRILNTQLWEETTLGQRIDF
jgi:hypothetical protein